METDRDKGRAEKEKSRAELQAREDARFGPIEPKRQVAPLWTDEDEILRIADLRYEALIGPLDTRERRVTRSLSARHSLGLSLDVVVVRYQAWAPTAAVDPVSDGASDAGSETVAAPWPEAWSKLPEDKTRLRFEAGSGQFIDWLHNPWCRGIGAPCPEEDEAREVVEAREGFSEGYHFHESWPDTSTPSHRILIWKRYVDGDLVEHDTAYANVRGGDLEIAQLLTVVSPLDAGLDLNEEAGDDALGDAFREQFPDSVRCGTIRRVYILLEDEPVRRLAWVGNAIDQGRPLEVAVGSGGEVLRVQRTG